MFYIELNELPNNCIECKLCTLESSMHYCKITNEDCSNPYAERNQSCPIRIK